MYFEFILFSFYYLCTHKIITKNDNFKIIL